MSKESRESKFWSNEEIEKLKDLAKKGFNYQEISDAIGRSPHSVKTKAIKLCIRTGENALLPSKNKAISILSVLESEAREQGLSYGNYVARKEKTIGRI